MDIMYVEARGEKVEFPERYIERLPDDIGLATTVQFVGSIEKIKKKLEKKGKKVKLVKGLHSTYPGQILGCDVPEMNVDAFLYIGTGTFHPKALAHKEVFVYNPVSGKLKKFPAGSQKRGALMRFHSSKMIGVLISTKPGQQNFEKALGLKERFPKKKFYFLVFDTLDTNSLENFRFIECFVNTACPRIIDDQMPRPVINLGWLMRSS